jgi:hypothetical protein
MKSFWTKLTRKVSGTPVVRVRTEHVLEARHICALLARHVAFIVDQGTVKFLVDQQWTPDFDKCLQGFTATKIESMIKQTLCWSGLDAANEVEQREAEAVIASAIVARVLPRWAAGALAYGESLVEHVGKEHHYAVIDFFIEQKEALEKKFQNV